MSQTLEPTIERMTYEEVLNKHGAVVFTNVGFSMMPLLRQRKDVIEVRKKEPGRCKKYDVVLYKRGEKYILHRILKVLPDGYIIAGDHCAFVEKDITDENILGVMTRVLRNGKNITPDNIWYKLYVHLWCDAYPVRMILLKIKWRVYGIFNGVKRRIKRILKI